MCHQFYLLLDLTVENSHHLYLFMNSTQVKKYGASLSVSIHELNRIYY